MLFINLFFLSHEAGYKELFSCILPLFRNIEFFNLRLVGQTALFQVDAILSSPKIVLQPNFSEIYWLIVQCVRDCVESTSVGHTIHYVFNNL